MTFVEFKKLPRDEAWNFIENAHKQRDEAIARIDTMEIQRETLLADHADALKVKDEERANVEASHLVTVEALKSELSEMESEVRDAIAERDAAREITAKLSKYDPQFREDQRKKRVADKLAEMEAAKKELADLGVEV